MTQPSTANVRTANAATVDEFAADVRYYLSLEPRQLPSQYLYDALGSALFEAICLLPWYAVTRAESRLLAAHADAVFAGAGPVSTLVELGPGSGAKLRLLLDSAASRRGPLDVHLVDVSASALAVAAQTLEPLPDVRVVTHQATYDAGLRDARAWAGGRTLVAFLGSNIGNFDPAGAAALLHNLRASLAPGDALLLGVDLVKSEQTLLLAYDDPIGLTAAFNKNLLLRINRELGGTFDLDQFAHRAVWDAGASRVEMHLVARASQAVHIPGAAMDFRIEAGEWIWTESSYKYDLDDLAGRLKSCGFRMAEQWVDQGDGFALTLAAAV